jgi:hypothetical protein
MSHGMSLAQTMHEYDFHGDRNGDTKRKYGQKQ